MRYINPQKTLIEDHMGWGEAFIYNLFTIGLFMFIYLIYKKIWQHAIIYLVLSFLVIPAIIYPFYINSIVRKHYLTNGWSEATDIDEQLDCNSDRRTKTGDYVFISIMIALVVTIVVQLIMMKG